MMEQFTASMFCRSASYPIMAHHRGEFDVLLLRAARRSFGCGGEYLPMRFNLAEVVGFDRCKGSVQGLHRGSFDSNHAVLVLEALAFRVFTIVGGLL